jgi:hypothetical protein
MLCNWTVQQSSGLRSPDKDGATPTEEEACCIARQAGKRQGINEREKMKQSEEGEEGEEGKENDKPSGRISSPANTRVA